MKACILAGGKGTRLGNLTAHTPKPLLDVNGKPFVRYIIDFLLQNGIKDIVLATGYLHDEFVKYENILAKDCDTFHIIKEDHALGTGGGILNCKKSLSNVDNFIVLNGDTFFEFDMQTALKTYSYSHNHLMVLREVQDVSRYGEVTLSNGLVDHYNEKSSTGKGLINTGFYIFHKSIFDYIPSGKEISLEKSVLPQLVQEQKLAGIKAEGYFIDIGLKDTYAQVQKDFKKREIKND